jgi:putative oxidoreductase
MQLREAILRTNAPAATVLKPACAQRGRDEEFLNPFDGVVEIVCGALLIAGLLTRLAAVPLIIDMLVAILTTKLPMLVHQGFRAAAHEARTDFTMLLGSLFLLIAGAGAWSIDSRLSKKTSAV